MNNINSVQLFIKITVSPLGFPGIKTCKPTEVLGGLYNASLESGIFPDQLKIAKVVPLYKQRDTRDIQNYRPIALLCLSPPPKLLEKLVYNRVMAFMEGNGVLNKAQHGLRTKKPTEIAYKST
jgi:hypothetical protein